MSDPTESPVIDYGTKSRPNLAAAASLAFGLLLFVPLVTGLLAIFFGRAGMRAAREEFAGRYRMARAGFVLGILNLVLTVAVAIGYGVHECRASQMRRCSANLKAIGLAMLMYSNSNRGRIPPSFDALVTTGQLPAGSFTFTCPACAGDNNKLVTLGPLVRSHYVLVPEWTPPGGNWKHFGSFPVGVVRAYEPLRNHDRRGAHFLFEDGRVHCLDAALAAKTIAELESGQNPPPALKGTIW